uniref:Uncharacterized protein n=1 Tax=Arundo donax TaxID=35708 RepID=A0A0A9BR33_ARUDO
MSRPSGTRSAGSRHRAVAPAPASRCGDGAGGVGAEEREQVV